MSVEFVISLSYLYNGNLQNVEGDISNVNQQSKESRANAIDSNITKGSVSEDEIENNSANTLMEETEEYEKLNKIMYVLGMNVLLLTLYYLNLVVVFAYVYSDRFVDIFVPIILMSNLFIVCVSRVWIYSKEANIIRIIISSLVSVIISGEILFYYYNCIQLHKLTLRHKSRSYYKQTRQHVDDLRCMVWIVTVLHVIPLFTMQILLFWQATQLGVPPAPVPQIKTMMMFALLCFISAIVTSFCCNYNDELDEKHQVTIVTVLMTCTSVCIYLFDVFSDLFLAGTYFYAQQWLYACLTLTFIIVPGFYITWLRHYRDEKKIHWNPLNLVKIMFNLDPVHGYWKSIKLITEVKHCQINESLDSGSSEDRKKSYAELVKNNYAIAVTRYNESYTESVMQLLLQHAILLQQFYYDPIYFDFFSTVDRIIWPVLLLYATVIKLLAIILSLISLAIGAVSMFRTKRILDYIDNEELKENDPLKWTDMFMQFMGYFPVVVTRVLAISFAASSFPVTTTCLLIGNSIVVFLFITRQLEASPLPYKIGQSVVYTFTPPIDDLTTEMSFHIVYLLQNVLLTIFWARTHLPPSARHTPIYLIFACNIIGVALRFYYQKNYKKIHENS